MEAYNARFPVKRFVSKKAMISNFFDFNLKVVSSYNGEGVSELFGKTSNKSPLPHDSLEYNNVKYNISSLKNIRIDGKRVCLTVFRLPAVQLLYDDDDASENDLTVYFGALIEPFSENTHRSHEIGVRIYGNWQANDSNSKVNNGLLQIFLPETDVVVNLPSDHSQLYLSLNSKCFVYFVHNESKDSVRFSKQIIGKSWKPQKEKSNLSTNEFQVNLGSNKSGGSISNNNNNHVISNNNSNNSVSEQSYGSMVNELLNIFSDLDQKNRNGLLVYAKGLKSMQLQLEQEEQDHWNTNILQNNQSHPSSSITSPQSVNGAVNLNYFNWNDDDFI